MTGVDRCMAIARIGKDSTKGMGTGFLLKGKELKKEWADEWLLITNAHVVSDDVKEGALKSHEAIVIFEALDGVIEFRDFEVLWTSPRNELDATLLRFNKDDQERLQQLMPRVKDYPVSKYLPAVEEPPAQKIYIIGHPGGGTLQLSFLDNLLIDHDKVSKIHYRTPTEGGSSGSPVFNQQWDLIGLHHAGAHDMPRLNGKQGYYEANEGIWIQAIKNKING
jgi:V8-like Glu-specific endopeptidase